MGVSFKREVIVVIRPAWINERGDLMPDWDNATEHVVPGCRVQPATGDEIHGRRDAVINRWNLYAPANADITALDRVRHDGIVCEVDGNIRQWKSPTGALAHIEAQLKRAEG